MSATVAIQNLKRGDKVVCPDGQVRTVQQVTHSNFTYLPSTVSFWGTFYTLDRHRTVRVEVVA